MFCDKVPVPNMDSALNIDTANIFKRYNFDREMTLHVRRKML